MKLQWCFCFIFVISIVKDRKFNKHSQVFSFHMHKLQVADISLLCGTHQPLTYFLTLSTPSNTHAHFCLSPSLLLQGTQTNVVCGLKICPLNSRLVISTLCCKTNVVCGLKICPLNSRLVISTLCCRMNFSLFD